MASMVESNKQTVKGYLEVGFAAAGKGDTKALDRYFLPDHTVHAVRHHDAAAKGIEGTLGYAAEVMGSIKDFKIQVDQLIGEEDWVAAHWHVTGVHEKGHKLAHVGQVAGTGKDLNVSGVTFCKMKDGKIAELWAYDNVLSVLMQIGAVPTPSKV